MGNKLTPKIVLERLFELQRYYSSGSPENRRLDGIQRRIMD